MDKDVRANLWERININKYIPINNKDRKFVGQNWNQRYLKGIQCILNATHGVVSPKRKFFEAAFGKNIDEFKRLILMPDRYIIYREDHKNNGASDWAELYDSLSAIQQEEFHNIVFKNKFDIEFATDNLKVKSLLSHYKTFV
ncbi:MAG: hypothetical protein ABIK92_17405 [Pseudomonadota bacterium]